LPSRPHAKVTHIIVSAGVLSTTVPTTTQPLEPHASNGCNSGVRFPRPVTLVLGAAALAFTSTAAAKDFGPGDLSICNAKRCMAITDRQVLDSLSIFYYGNTQLSMSGRPRMRSPFFQLRFRNGYVTGIVASAPLDRFLSYGVNLGRFQRGKWYRMPEKAALELRKLTTGLKPLRLSFAAVAKSH
jgi:hypothetical protein